MADYQFTEENGMGVLKKKVHHEGQPDTWEEDMKSPVPSVSVDEQYVKDKIADVVNSIEIADETNGDITVGYEE